jgi:hypothetical protein
MNIGICVAVRSEHDFGVANLSWHMRPRFGQSVIGTVAIISLIMALEQFWPIAHIRPSK